MTTNIDTNYESNLFKKYNTLIDDALAHDDFDEAGNNLDDLHDEMSRNSESRRKFDRLANTTISRIRTRMSQCDEYYDWTNLYNASDALTSYVSFTEHLSDDEYDYLIKVRNRARKRQGDYDTGIATLFLAEDETPDIPDHVDTPVAASDTDDNYQPAFIAHND